jgi:hypothetical protein
MHVCLQKINSLAGLRGRARQRRQDPRPTTQSYSGAQGSLRAGGTTAHNDTVKGECGAPNSRLERGVDGVEGLHDGRGGVHIRRKDAEGCSGGHGGKTCVEVRLGRPRGKGVGRGRASRHEWWVAGGVRWRVSAQDCTAPCVREEGCSAGVCVWGGGRWRGAAYISGQGHQRPALLRHQLYGAGEAGGGEVG